MADKRKSKARRPTRATKRTPTHIGPGCVEDPRLASDLKRYAVHMRGKFKYAICVPFGEVRTHPMPNDLVHVRRTRTHDNLYEDTLRTVRISHGRVQLVVFPDTEKKYEGSVVAFPSRRVKEHVELRGLVVGFFEPLPF